MGKFKDVNCPICKKPLENGETIVVCPDCGTPYHKGCVDTVGRCIQDELHATGKTFELPKPEHQYAADEEKRCSRCGTLNPVGGLFCVVCGNELHQSADKEEPVKQQPLHGGQAGGPPPFGGAQPYQMPYDPYNAPFGGVSPDDSIQDIPVRDWAIYVGQNTAYFIPKFKIFDDHKSKASFNVPAMLFGGMYFLYRKMYLWAVILLLFRIIIAIPSSLLQLDILREMVGAETLYTNDTVYMLENICFFLNLASMGLCGIFTNWLYRLHCHKQIKKLQSVTNDDQQYRAKLTETGSVSRLAITIVLAVYFLASMGLSMLLVESLML